jgi:hypothetical protein
VAFIGIAMTFTAKEKKLIVLAFDAAAHEGEMQNSISALIRSLKYRYADGHAFIRDAEATVERPCADVVLRFGKHKGKTFKEVPESYLIWCLENFQDMDARTKSAMEYYLGKK